MSTATLVGLGNRWRGDDGVGLEVARRLSAEVGPSVHVVEHEGEPTALIDIFGASDEVIVVDAVSSQSAPGTIHRLSPLDEPLPVELMRGSTHAVGLAEVIELARRLDRLPARLLFYGIEGRNFGVGAAVTPDVRRAAAALVSELEIRLAGRARP